jgi:queuine tRNA-ribosyltransferase
VRNDPARLRFEIQARDGDARAGLIRTPNGDVHTPAFVPLATKGSVRGLSSAEVAGLGYEMVLGNTFHLLMAPGPERLAELGGLRGFMGWEGAIISDSGGFQVFSLAHGGVADEIKGRRGELAGAGADVRISEDGVEFRDLDDGSARFLGPESSMEIQAAIGSDIALAFDECTPFHADRDYTARSTERTSRWLTRCLDWHRANGPPGQAVFGIVQGGVYEELRRESAEAISSAGVDGIAIGGSLGQDKAEMYGVVEMTVPMLPADAPKHLLGIGEPDDFLAAVAAGIDTLDCAVPTRLARHGVALAPDPGSRFRLDLAKARFASEDLPIAEGCPCEACTRHSRAYLHHLARAADLTGTRLLVKHNLVFMQELMLGAQEAIRSDRFDQYRGDLLAGDPPWSFTAQGTPE